MRFPEGKSQEIWLLAVLKQKKITKYMKNTWAY